MLVFPQKLAEKLKALRKKTDLTQQEVADWVGLKATYGPSFIAHLENGLIPNPSLRTVIDYLRICGVSGFEFFRELAVINFKQRHEKLVAQPPILPESDSAKGQFDQGKRKIKNIGCVTKLVSKCHPKSVTGE